jgi:RNA polymerase sigma-70 factor (ECF subfamily)
MSVSTARPELTAADRRWFGERVDALLPELYGAATRLCRNRTDAEDLVSEAVAKAWGALPSLKDRSSLRAWVFRILNNTFVSSCRSAEAQVEHEWFDTAASEPFSLFERLHQPILLWWSNPELQFLNRLLREDIERALDDLPPAFREVVVMVDVQGQRYAEVADVLSIPIGTVRSRLSRGRSLLQETLWEQAREAGLTEGPSRNNSNENDDDDRDPDV